MNKRWGNAIMIADADYLVAQSFISKDDRDKIVRWTIGSGDPEVGEMIARWAILDADYCAQMRNETCRFLWFIGPFMWLGIKAMEWYMRRYAKEANK